MIFYASLNLNRIPLKPDDSKNSELRIKLAAYARRACAHAEAARGAIKVAPDDNNGLNFREYVGHASRTIERAS